MIDKKSITNKTSGILIKLSKKIKIITIFISTYFVFLILYDIILFERTFKDIIATYLGVIVIGNFIWFGLRFILWLQIKNKNCPEIFLNIYILVSLIIFGISSFVVGIHYFIDGFLISTFISPLAFLSVMKVQFMRK